MIGCSFCSFQVCYNGIVGIEIASEGFMHFPGRFTRQPDLHPFFGMGPSVIGGLLLWWEG